MFCNNCGSQIDNNAVVCPHCGVATGNFNRTPAQAQNTTNGMAIAGFVLSFFFSLLGLIFSILGLKKSAELGNGRGLAIAGIIISCIELFVWILLIIIIASIASASATLLLR